MQAPIFSALPVLPDQLTYCLYDGEGSNITMNSTFGKSSPQAATSVVKRQLLSSLVKSL